MLINNNESVNHDHNCQTMCVIQWVHSNAACDLETIIPLSCICKDLGWGYMLLCCHLVCSRSLISPASWIWYFVFLLDPSYWRGAWTTQPPNQAAAPGRAGPGSCGAYQQRGLQARPHQPGNTGTHALTSQEIQVRIPSPARKYRYAYPHQPGNTGTHALTSQEIQVHMPSPARKYRYACPHQPGNTGTHALTSQEIQVHMPSPARKYRYACPHQPGNTGTHALTSQEIQVRMPSPARKYRYACPHQPGNTGTHALTSQEIQVRMPSPARKYRYACPHQPGNNNW